MLLYADEDFARDLEVPKVGLEPTPSCEDRILSPGPLPYTWYWKHVASDT